LGKQIDLKMIVIAMDDATLSSLLFVIADKINPKKQEISK